MKGYAGLVKGRQVNASDRAVPMSSIGRSAPLDPSREGPVPGADPESARGALSPRPNGGSCFKREWPWSWLLSFIRAAAVATAQAGATHPWPFVP